MKTISVTLPQITYSIKIQRGLLNHIAQHLLAVYSGARIFIVTDTNVAPLYEAAICQNLRANGYTVNTYIVPAGETSKSLGELQNIYSFLVREGASRKDLLIALGGGVIGDMAGFAAATYMRGMPFVQIPTTLLAQIDSSVGGKVAVNLPEGKNLVGAFYQPLLVLIDPDCLNTLPERVLADGAAEALKYGYIKDPELYQIFRKLNSITEIHPYLDEIIFRCCDIKRGVVERDEKESGERMILNFGHTIGHAYESYYHYNKYTHGEAVAIGMAEICSICYRHGYVSKEVVTEIHAILTALHLPVSDCEADRSQIIENMYKDKKSGFGTVKLVLLKQIGEVFIKSVQEEDLQRFLKEGGFLSCT